MEEEADYTTSDYVGRLEIMVRGLDYITADFTSMVSAGPVPVEPVFQVIVKLSYLKECLLAIMEHWRTYEQEVHYRQFTATSVRTGGPGRPKFKIS